jgi:uncharacterized protein (TIGR01244 family)
MSATFRKVTDGFWAAGQIDADDVRAAADQGIRLIINNRPDGEAPGQPPGSEIEAAARTAGLGYVAVPMRGPPDAAQVQAVREALDGADGPALGYCAGGLRSIVIWALAEAGSGRRTRDEVLALARNAGYDLSSIL